MCFGNKFLRGVYHLFWGRVGSLKCLNIYGTMFFCGFLVWAGLKLWAGFLAFGESFCVGDFIFVFFECLSVQTGGPGHGHGALAQSLGPQAQDADSHCLGPRQGAQGPGPRPPPSRCEKTSTPRRIFSHARGPRHRGAKKFAPPVEFFRTFFRPLFWSRRGGLARSGRRRRKTCFPHSQASGTKNLTKKIIRQILLIIFRQVFLWGRGTLLTGWSV